MKKLVTLLTVMISFFVASHAAEYKKVNLTQKNKEFLQMMIPQVKFVNHGIYLQRKTLEISKRYFIKTGILTVEDIQVINGIAARYKYDEFKVEDFGSREEVLEYFDALLERVDIIPEKMIIAQGIIESGWGRSRSARECNNYFGLTCRDCGGYVVTSNPNATYYLKKYETLGECIQDYANILNTKSSYLSFRKIRTNMRKNNQELNSQELAGGLVKYSELGYRYIYKVNFVIHKYLPNDLLYYMHLG
jgi:Bax protein